MSMWNIGGALLGGLLGGQSSTQSNTTTNSPYAPAKPYIDQTISNGMSLQKQYAAQPLSLGQIEAYGNSKGLSDGYRSQAGSLTQQIGNMRQFDRNNPTAKATQFTFNDAPVNQQQSMETFLSSLPESSQVDLGRRIVEGGLLANQPSGGGGGRDSIQQPGTWQGGIGTGNLTDTINDQAMATFKSIAPFSIPVGGVVAMYQRNKAMEEELARANAAQDPIAHLNSVQGWTGGGGGSGGGAGSYFGGGYDGSGFAGLGGSGYGNSGYGSSDVSDSDISSN